MWDRVALSLQCEVFLRTLNYPVLLVQKRDLFTGQCMQRELLFTGDSLAGSSAVQTDDGGQV